MILKESLLKNLQLTQETNKQKILVTFGSITWPWRKIRFSSTAEDAFGLGGLADELINSVCAASLSSSESVCSADKTSEQSAPMQVSVSEEFSKEELNQNQPQSLGCIAAGWVLQEYGVCVFCRRPVVLDDWSSVPVLTCSPEAERERGRQRAGPGGGTTMLR